MSFCLGIERGCCTNFPFDGPEFVQGLCDNCFFKVTRNNFIFYFFGFFRM